MKARMGGWTYLTEHAYSPGSCLTIKQVLTLPMHLVGTPLSEPGQCTVNKVDIGRGALEGEARPTGFNIGAGYRCAVDNL